MGLEAKNQININAIKGNLKPIGNRVLVSDMHFGEQKTKGGLIILDDDAQSRGIYPRWGKVYAKGPKNEDDYAVGECVLVEHGRWTRGVLLQKPNGEELVIRRIDFKDIMATSDEPTSTYGSNGSI